MSPVGGGADSAAFDVRRLCQALEKEGALSGAELLASRPHLFSAAQVRVGEADLTFMARLIAAIEAVIARPAAQALFLACAPVTARMFRGKRIKVCRPSQAKALASTVCGSTPSS